MYMTGSGRDCKRQLYQILYDELGEKQGAVKALKSQCISWLAARRWFKRPVRVADPVHEELELGI